MLSEVCRYDPPVTPGKMRQDAKQVRIGRSIVNQQELPILISLRQNGLDRVFEAFHGRIEYGRDDADQWPRSEHARLITHQMQILLARPMLLEPLLVFGCRMLSLLSAKFSPNVFREYGWEAIRREKNLTNSGLRGLAQPSPFFS